MPFPNAGRAFVVALLLATPALTSKSWAQMPPPRPMLHSKTIDDCGPKPLPGELCRLPVAFEADDAEKHLDGKDLVFWVDGKTLNIAARAMAEEAVLDGSVEEGMVPLSTRRPMWGSAFRLTEIDKAVIELKLRGHPGAEVVYRGPNAPKPPAASATLAGKLDTLEVKSAALGPRKLQLYVPPGKAPAGGWPVVIAAGIEDLAPYAAIADALIQQRQVRPLAIVSLGAGEGEYLRNSDPSAFFAHRLFVSREVMPLAEKQAKLSQEPRDRMLWGIGAGGDWALDAVTHDAAMAVQVAAFSPPGLAQFPFRNRQLKLYLQAGAYEAPYLKGARTTCNLAAASFSACKLDVTYSGHAPLIWQAEWAKVLREAFPRR
ncbi:MAG: alpha/beta hydrolase [Caulobacteraceae bacterium]